MVRFLTNTELLHWSSGYFQYRQCCVMIPASMAAIILVSSEVHQATYDPEQSCTTDEAQTVVKKRSRVHCYLNRHKALFLKLSQLVPDARQDVIEGVETLDRKVRYDWEQSCTADEAQTVVKKRTKLHCAAACSGQPECREYNFDETTTDCSLYKHKSLFSAVQPGCSGYKARYPLIDIDVKRKRFLKFN